MSKPVEEVKLMCLDHAQMKKKTSKMLKIWPSERKDRYSKIG